MNRPLLPSTAETPRPRSDARRTRRRSASAIPVITAIGILTSAPCATAVTMLVSFEGVITNSFVFTDPFGFGTGTGVLNGRTIHGSFQYESSLAPPDSDSDPKQVFRRTTSNSGVWFSTPEVFIDGVAVPVPSFDLFPGLTSDTALIELKNELNSGADVVAYTRTLYQFADSSNIHSFDLDISVDSLASGVNLIDSLSIEEPYSINDFSNLNTLGTSISSRRTDGGVDSYNFSADFALTPNTLSVTVVPEPSAAGLLLGGAGLALLCRSRRS
jgi:hypothetical protein